MRSRPSSARSAIALMLSAHRFASSCPFTLPHRLLDRIELRGVAWQRLDLEPAPLTGDPLGHTSTAMRRQAIPDQQDQAVFLMLVDCSQKLDQRFTVVGASAQLKD